MNLQERLEQANQSLAPYAVPHQGTLGREYPEQEDPMRFPFVRDRERIVHSQAFRRLGGKTQVFVTGEGDHYRTRLTHTREVEQPARDICRYLRLNEDVAECIALAHDLGHPPFGHAGEAALDEALRPHGIGFEHNQQSLRIVTMLEQHGAHQGLNLNKEILEGIRKHEELTHGRTLEAQITDNADQIAYLGHDSDDGLRRKIFTLEELAETALGKRAIDAARERSTSPHGKIIEMLSGDLITVIEANIARLSLKTIADVYALQEDIVHFSDVMQRDVRELRRFLFERMYNHPSVRAANMQGQRIVHTLVDGYMKNPPQKVQELMTRTGSTLAEAVRDYVAGMTDNYARSQAALL